MGYVLVHSACVQCGQFFSYNPHLGEAMGNVIEHMAHEWKKQNGGGNA